MSQVTLLPSERISPSVSIHSGRPATTSREIATFFGKRHDDVIKSIRNLRPNCPEEFTARNFAASEYTDETGRTLPMFILYRDGFMLLVMGYTGKKALAMKLAYIEAFNRMEAEIAARSRPLAEDMVLPEPELPAAERLPLFRNGCFYLPGINKNHVPGPREAALMDLWQTWNRQTAGMEREFMSMMRELERRRGDLFAVAVSELGRDADTAFSFESLMEGLFCAHDMAQRYFKEAIALQRLSIRLSVNVAVALGR